MSERPTKEATFDSRCMVCDEMIREGDTIALLELGSEFVHEACAEDTEWVDG